MNTSIKATKLNAVSTFISGLSILLFSHPLASLFEISSPLPFLIVGGVITLFSLTMFIEIKRQRALAILWIITQDFMFTIASIYILIFKPFEISEVGYLLIGLFLIPIVFFIIYQTIGLAKLDTKAGSNGKHLVIEQRVKADQLKVWEIVSDVANYHEVAPNIDRSEVISGEKLGMVRSCAHGKDSWTETCTLWDEGKAFAFEVDTTAPDYPYPLKKLRGKWQVSKVDEVETEIRMHFEFEYKYAFYNWLIHPIMKSRFIKICDRLFDNWQKRIEG